MPDLLDADDAQAIEGRAEVVDVVGMPGMWEHAPSRGLLEGVARKRVDVMARQPLELPTEARDLIEQVRSLEARAERVRDELERDLAGIRQTAREERESVEKGLVAHLKATEAELSARREATDTELSKQRKRAATELAARRELADADLASVTAEVAAHRARLAKDRAALEALLENRVHGFDFIASAWADYELARAADDAFELETKAHPARSAAERVREKGRQLAEARRELKRVQWVLSLYEFHFPWLTELRDFEEEVSYVKGELEHAPAAEANGAALDPAQRWLSKEEFAALSEAERNQRALDRYLTSRKTPWQVGRDYERYIGFLREQAGAKVTYEGIFAGLEDLGRDLISETAESVEVIQCKRWAKRKTIHEKHVFQLFGTVVAMRIKRPDKEVTGTFTTTTTLSERAHQFADQLGVRVEEDVPLPDYPRIKCNISRGGQRIYHLPFDQQYDTTLIEPERGEHWAATVAEAEGLGFRRAWQWNGTGARAGTV